MNIFKHHFSFQLESGVVLPSFHLGYSTLGTLNADKNNVVWVFHALTANSNPAEWWDGLVGDNKLFNPQQHFIVCVNMPGSCYGSIHPLDIDSNTGEPYYHQFPLFTIRDMVNAYQHLKIFLGIDKIFVGLGGSMGGQQLLEWAVKEPHLFEHIIPIATNAVHSPWAIAFNASQRMCIEADSSWSENNEAAGIDGMKVARSVALLSYRNYETYHLNQLDENKSTVGNFKSESYQRYQGEKLAKRFNAFSYYFLSKSMDSHNLGRNRTSVIDALKRIAANTIVIGVETDMLFPISEQKFLAKHIPGAALAIIKSTFGHDGFLLEFKQIEDVIEQSLAVKKIASITA